MKKPYQSLSTDEQAMIRAVVGAPRQFAQDDYEAVANLMIALAAGELTGEDLELACQVRETDAAAKEIHDLLANLPSVDAPAGSRASILEQFTTGLSRTLRAIYDEIAENRAAELNTGGHTIVAQGDEAVPEEIILVQGQRCVLRRSRLPEGDYDVELVIPPAVNIAPEDLARLELKVVDRPQPLVFQRRPNGNLVANYVLPSSVDDPSKEIVVVIRPPAT